MYLGLERACGREVSKIVCTEDFLEWIEEDSMSIDDLAGLTNLAEQDWPQRGWYSDDFCKQKKMEIEIARSRLHELVAEFREDYPLTYQDLVQ